MPRTLFPGAQGDDVRAWQEFLCKRGFSVVIDGIYGSATKAATADLQRTHALLADGICGPETRALAWPGALVVRAAGNVAGAVGGSLVKAGKAVWLALGGLTVLAFSKKTKAASPWVVSPPGTPLPGWPVSTDMSRRWFPYITPAERDELFGPLRVIPSPSPTNPEAVHITNDFGARIIPVRFDELRNVAGATGGVIQIHESAAESLAEVLRDLDRRGLVSLVRSFSGSWVPRFVRGSKETLSAHAYGTALDINADENPQGSPPTASQTELARVFAEHGWFWGDWFASTRDPMHFEFIGRSSGRQTA